MSFRRVSLLLLFLHVSMPCEVDWGCKTCVYQDCHYVLTKTGKSVCVGEGGPYPAWEQIVKQEMLCGKFENRQVYTEKPVHDLHHFFTHFYMEKDQQHANKSVSLSATSSSGRTASTVARGPLEPLEPSKPLDTLSPVYWQPSKLSGAVPPPPPPSRGPQQAKQGNVQSDWYPFVRNATRRPILQVAVIAEETAEEPARTLAPSPPSPLPSHPPSPPLTKRAQITKQRIRTQHSDGVFRGILATPTPHSNQIEREVVGVDATSPPPPPPKTTSKPVHLAAVVRNASQQVDGNIVTKYPIPTTPAAPTTPRPTRLPSTTMATHSTLPPPPPPLEKPAFQPKQDEQPQQRDMTRVMVDQKDFFMIFPYTTDCTREDQNATLLFSYASSLCTISTLVDRIGIETIDEITRGWLYLNPGRRYTGTCKAIRYTRKKCRVQGPRNNKPIQPSLKYGPPSTLFSSVDTALKCDAKEKRESAESRLARMMCYAASLFVQVEHAISMNNFDISFGMSNSAFRYQYKCKALYYRRRHCYHTQK